MQDRISQSKQLFQSNNFRNKNPLKHSNHLQFKAGGLILMLFFFDQIDTWSFTSKTKLLRSQQKNHYCFRDIVFNHTTDWFISANNDFSIQFWEEKIAGNWSGAKRIKKHKSLVQFLLLHKNEDKLIANSGREIIFWKINVQTKYLELDQYFDLPKQYGSVKSINFNDSNTKLISCTSKQLIILWGQGRNNLWQQLSEYRVEDGVLNVQFQNDSQIISEFYKNASSIIFFFDIQNGQLIPRPKLQQFILNEAKTYFIQYPCIYNSRRRIFVQIQENQILLLEKIEDKLKKASNFQYPGKVYIAALTKDGNFLAIQSIKGLHIHRINYHDQNN